MIEHHDGRKDTREDVDLVAAFRDGDETAAAELYRRYYLRLVRGIAPKLPSFETAEDCVGTSFVKVLEIIKRGLGPTTNVYGYLRSTVVSESANFYRINGPLIDHDDLDDRGDPGLLAIDFQTEIDEPSVQSALQSLPEHWRQLVTLRYVENRMPAEMAELLNAEVSALSRMLFRAKNGLLDAYLKQFVISRSIGSCVSYSSDLADYAAGRLKTSRTEALQLHLEGCADCQQNLAEVRHQRQRVSPAALGLVLLLGGIGAGTALTFGGTTKAAAATSITPKLLSAGSVFQVLGAVGSATLVTLTLASLAVGGWLTTTGGSSTEYRDPATATEKTHSQIESPQQTTVSTTDGDCDLTVSVKNGQLIAEATVHRGDCWFTYQRFGGETRPEVKVTTGWQFVTGLAGTYDFDFRSNEDSTSYTVTL